MHDARGEQQRRSATRRGFIAGIAAGGAAQHGGPLLAADAHRPRRPSPATPTGPGPAPARSPSTPDGRTLWTADTAGTTITAHRAPRPRARPLDRRRRRAARHRDLARRHARARDHCLLRPARPGRRRPAHRQVDRARRRARAPLGRLRAGRPQRLRRRRRTRRAAHARASRVHGPRPRADRDRRASARARDPARRQARARRAQRRGRGRRRLAQARPGGPPHRDAPFPYRLAVSRRRQARRSSPTTASAAAGHAARPRAPARRPRRRGRASTPPASPSTRSGRARGRRQRRRRHASPSSTRRTGRRRRTVKTGGAPRAVAVAGRPQLVADGAHRPPHRDPRWESFVDEHDPPGGAARGRRRRGGELGAGALGPAAPPGGRRRPARKPNVLILMCDQERYPQWTPDLPLPARDWIDSRGVSFERFHHSAVQCSSSRACFWTGHVHAAERDLRQLPAELAVLAGPAHPDDRRPDARPGLHDRLLRQVAPEHGRRCRCTEGPVENVAEQLPRPVRLRLLRAVAVARAGRLQRRRLQRPDLDQAGRSTGCTSTAARSSRGCASSRC